MLHCMLLLPKSHNKGVINEIFLHAMCLQPRHSYAKAKTENDSLELTNIYTCNLETGLQEQAYHKTINSYKLNACQLHFLILAIFSAPLPFTSR